MGKDSYRVIDISLKGEGEEGEGFNQTFRYLNVIRSLGGGGGDLSGSTVKKTYFCLCLF